MALGYMDDNYLINIADAIREKTGNGPVKINDRYNINNYASGGTFRTVGTPDEYGSMYSWASLSNSVTGEQYTIINLFESNLVYTVTIPPLENISDWDLNTEIDYAGTSVTYKLPSTTYTPAEMPDAIRSIETSEEIVLQDKNYSVTSNGIYTIQEDAGYDGMSSVNLTVSINDAPELQAKTVSPTATTQHITADSGYDGLSQVTVNACSGNVDITSTASVNVVGKATAKVSDADLVVGNIKSGVNILGVAGTYTSDATATAAQMLSGATAYVKGSKITGNIPTKTSSNLTANGATVTVPAGYYASQATKSVASGSATTPATTITGTPDITVGTDGKISVSVSGSKSVTPTIGAGYISSGTAGTITVSGSATKQLTTQAAKTVTPTKASQTAVSSGVYTTGAITVAGDNNLIADNIKSGISIFGTTGTFTNDATATANSMLNGYTGYVKGNKVTGNIPTKTEEDLIVSGETITTPAGYYAAAATQSVATTERAATTMTVTADDSADKIVVSAANNQGTGWVTGSNQTASTTIALTNSGNTVTATATNGSKISRSVATVERATTQISTSIKDNKFLLTASNNQGTGWVTSDSEKNTAGETISLNTSVSGPTVTAIMNTSEDLAIMSEKTVAITTQATPSVALNASTGLVTATSTQSTGYVYGDTTSSTLQLATQNGQTLYPSAEAQTAVAKNKFTLGDVTVAPCAGNVDITSAASFNVVGKATAKIKDSALKAENIAKDITVLGIVGTHETPFTYEDIITPAAYSIEVENKHVKKIHIDGDPNLQAGNIVAGVEIFGVTGTAYVPPTWTGIYTKD